MATYNYNCRECGTPIQGDSELCISCYNKLHKPCPKCMERCGKFGKKWRPRKEYRTVEEYAYSTATGQRVKHKLRRLFPVDCSCCNNERWIIAR